MKSNRNKLSIDAPALQPIPLSMVAFLIAFLIQLLFVFKWNYFRYPYEEFQIMAMGAKFSNYSWDYLYSSAPYGGVIFIPFYKMLFSLGVSGTVAYRVMRWGMAVLNAIPAYISTKIAAKYYKLDSKVSIALGLASTLFSVSRASSVRAESILAVLAWLFIYFLICYGHTSNRGQRVGYSVVAGFILALLVITNVKTVILVPALIITVVLVRVFKKKWIVNNLVFIPSFLIGSGILNYVFDRVLLNYSAGQEWETSWTIQMQEYLYSIARGFQRLHMSHAARGFCDLLFSNIWMIAVFSFGIVVYAFINTISSIREEKEEREYEIGILLFLGIGALFSVIALSFIEIKTGIYLHSRDGAPNSFLFNLSTYGYLVCPLLILELMTLVKARKGSVRSYYASIIIVLYSALFLIVSVIVPAVHDGHTSMKWWFGYETSFLVMLNQWSDQDTAIWFFIIPTVIVIFMMWCYHKSGDFKTAVILLLLVSIVQYNYIEGYWANRTVYRDRFDAFIDCVNNGALRQMSISDVHLDGDTDTAYAMQLALPEITIHVGAPEEYEKHIVILTSGRPYDVSMSYNLDSSYKAVTLDDNEYLITNDKEIINALSESLFVYDADTLVFDFVDFVYQNVLERFPDSSGRQAWSELLMSGEIEPSDMIISLLNSEEMAEREYSNEQLATTMVYAFLYYPSNSEIIPALVERLDDGETVEDIADDLIDNDRYSEILSTFRLHDSNADRVNCIVRRVYDCILERPADEYGLVEFGNMIRDYEMTPDDLVDMLIDSAEYQNMERSTEYTLIRMYIFYNDRLPNMAMVRSYADKINSGEMTYRDIQEIWSGSIPYHNMIMDYNMEEYV